MRSAASGAHRAETVTTEEACGESSQRVLEPNGHHYRGARTASKPDLDRMRWVCVDVCPSRPGCEREVEVDLAAARVVAGFRAGVSTRARTRRLAAEQEWEPEARSVTRPGSENR